MQIIKYFLFLNLVLTSCAYEFGSQNLVKTSNQELIYEKSKIEKLENSEDYQNSSELYKKLLLSEPNNPNILIKAAYNFRLNKNCDQALVYYNKILTHDNSNSFISLEAKEGKALCYMQQDNFIDALDLFKVIINYDATRWKVMNSMAIIFALTNHLKESIEYYNMALTISPNNPTIYNNMGLSYALNDNYDNALLFLQKALNFSSVSKVKKTIYFNLSLIYALKGNLNEAEKVIRSYISDEELENIRNFYKNLNQNNGKAKQHLSKALK